MAFAVIGGLAVATALTLVFLPSLYVAWFRVKDPGDHESAVDSDRIGPIFVQPKMETTEASGSADQPARDFRFAASE